ncbi:hypothetical protein V8F06_001610 [Rhypophila decipiens]
MTDKIRDQRATKRSLAQSTEAPPLKRHQSSDAGGLAQQPQPQLLRQPEAQAQLPQQVLQPVIQPSGPSQPTHVQIQSAETVAEEETGSAFTPILLPESAFLPNWGAEPSETPTFSPLLLPTVVDCQETDQYRAVWEFVVLYRLLRGSELCLSCQNTILDLISHDIRGSSVHSFGQLGNSLPPAFNRHYLDFLIDPVLDQPSSSSGTPEIPPALDTTPPQPPISASQLPDVAELTLEGPSSLRLRQLSPQSETQTQSPAGPSRTDTDPDPTSASDTCRIITSTRMFLHFPYFRSIISVIEAQGKIWITTRPGDFRATLHGRWMLALPEELKLKLWFACQGRYTLMDLAAGRPFSEPATSSWTDTDNIGDGTAYMTMMRRYLLFVAVGGVGFHQAQHAEAERCSCPGKGWSEEAKIVSTAAVLAEKDGSAPPAEDQDPSAEIVLNRELNCFVTGRSQSELLSVPEKLSSPPKTAYLAPQIISILEGSMSGRTLLELADIDWMSIAFPDPFLQHIFSHLSRTGRQILHHTLRELYQELAGAYQAAEPLPPLNDGPVENPYPASKPLEDYPDWDPLNRPYPRSGVKPTEHTFEACRMYVGLQMSVGSWRDRADMMLLSPSIPLSPWGLLPMDLDPSTFTSPSSLTLSPTDTAQSTTESVFTTLDLGPGAGVGLGLGINLGTETGTSTSPEPGHDQALEQRRREQKKERRDRRRKGKIFTRSVLTNQPWEWPSRSSWEGQGQEYLLAPATEMRDAIAFLAGGTMEWLRITNYS